ncbi:MAG: hypothetical protein QOG87_715 [Actinomycetota bacterium]|jgi:hypothetical protein
MGVVIVCSLLVVFGVVAIVRWGGLAFQPPWTADGEPIAPVHVARRYLWFVAVTTAAGAGAGMLMAGPGGRLAMRLLAATAGDSAQGRLTEAEETVGRISVGGSVGLVLFTALFFGLASGLLYMLIRRWLPAGRLGGLLCGALLVVLFSPAIDPLRKANPDFDIVGPGWLSVATFIALGLGQGMLVAAVAGRFSRSLPMVRAEAPVLARYGVVLPLFLFVAPAVVAIALGAVIVGLNQIRDLGELARRRQVVLAGRAVLIVATLATLPRFLGAVVDIAGRGP